MKIIGLRQLYKLKKRNIGNSKLMQAIHQFILDSEQASWKNKKEVKITRIDADHIAHDVFFFFDIEHHRLLILVEYYVPLSKTEGILTIIWVGNHNEYERVFKNNKHVIKRWLRINNWLN